jgi:hypothetical protein
MPAVPPPPPVTPAYLPTAAHPEPEPHARRAHLAVLASRLTTRDQWIIAMVHEHRVLTSTQISALAFDDERGARRRLATLTHQLRVLDRFRPRLTLGSAPEHYVLGPAGAAYLAAERDQSPKQFGYSRQRAHQIAVSAHLAHAVGCNEVFTRIAAAHRHDPDGGRLAAWWSERRCLRLWQDLARPDGYGHYTFAPRGADPGSARNLRFFLEYDTGTEPLGRLAAKLPGYAKLAAATTTQPVLFYLPNAARENNFHALLARDTPRVPVATSSPDALRAAATGPTGPVWRPVSGRARIPGRAEKRLTLIDLDTLLPAGAAPRSGAGPAAAPSWWVEPPPPLPPTVPEPER